jgi:hypothetical protein
MANMVIPNEGKLLWLEWALTGDGSSLEDFVVRLYSNNYTPVDGSTLANFTEATFTGYTELDIMRSDFSTPVIVANVAEAQTSVPPEWTCTGGAAQDIYGWYLVGVDSGKVLAAQRFDAVRTMAAGATETLDPFKIKLKTFA